MDVSPVITHSDVVGHEIDVTMLSPESLVGVDHVDPDMWENAPPSLTLPDAKHKEADAQLIPVVENPSL